MLSLRYKAANLVHLAGYSQVRSPTDANTSYKTTHTVRAQAGDYA